MGLHLELAWIKVLAILLVVGWSHAIPASLFDAKHGVKMGIPTHRCDNAKVGNLNVCYY